MPSCVEKALGAGTAWGHRELAEELAVNGTRTGEVSSCLWEETRCRMPNVSEVDGLIQNNPSSTMFLKSQERKKALNISASTQGVQSTEHGIKLHLPISALVITDQISALVRVYPCAQSSFFTALPVSNTWQHHFCRAKPPLILPKERAEQNASS